MKKKQRRVKLLWKMIFLLFFLLFLVEQKDDVMYAAWIAIFLILLEVWSSCSEKILFSTE